MAAGVSGESPEGSILFEEAVRDMISDQGIEWVKRWAVYLKNAAEYVETLL